MSEMIERVAVALRVACPWFTEELPGTDDDIQRGFEKMARAAIEAMREPALNQPDQNAM